MDQPWVARVRRRKDRARDAMRESWATSERFLHGSLAHTFHLVVGHPELAMQLSEDNHLRTCFSLLHVSSLRCMRLVLRLLRQLLSHRTLDSLSAALFAPPSLDGSTIGLGDKAVDDSSKTQQLPMPSDGTSNPLVVFLLTIVADQLVDDTPDAPPALLCCRKARKLKTATGIAEMKTTYGDTVAFQLCFAYPFTKENFK